MNENNYKFTFCNYKKNGKEINVFSKKKISFRDLLIDCEIGLSTVLLTKAVFLKIYSHH